MKFRGKRKIFLNNRRPLVKRFDRLNFSHRFSSAHKALQINWIPASKIEEHFIPMIFSDANRTTAAPIFSYRNFQHLGIAHVFYRNSDGNRLMIFVFQLRMNIFQA